MRILSNKPIVSLEQIESCLNNQCDVDKFSYLPSDLNIRWVGTKDEGHQRKSYVNCPKCKKAIFISKNQRD